jgi:hypothetical protein
VRLLERLLASLASALKVPEGTAAPAAVLWTDADGQWLPLIPQLRAVLPTFFTLGAYDPPARTGPAIWLKCIVDRALPEAPPAGETPILYLPHVGRQELRAAGDCPSRTQPLIELQYRGRVWHQSNGHDWTVQAFLVSDEGLGLDVARDRRTEEAFLRVLPILADTDASMLRGRRLDADDFDKLSVSDPVRDLLRWLNGPELFEAGAQGGRWDSFRNLCKSEFKIDPDALGASGVAAGILRGDSALEPVWRRFCEAPQLYPGIAKLLSEPSSGAQGLLSLDPGRNPRVNEDDETDLRKQLESAGNLPQSSAYNRVLELEQKHGPRREWVWARMGSSPWAYALVPLARLAKLSQSAVGGATLASVAAAYAVDGWRCDWAAMEALAYFRNTADAAVIARVVRALYEPWLDASSRHFQDLLRKQPAEARKAVGLVKGEKDTCLLFVDGLRFDLCGRLAEVLESRALSTKLSHRLAPLPTVTATAKPASTTVASEIKGSNGEDFTPLLQTATGLKPATAPLLRERMASQGVETLEFDETRIPAGSEAGGWAECGLIDSIGHSLQAELVYQLSSEVDKVADRVVTLLDSGWRRVRVVTDHGWLLLPDGLPKVELPAYLTETKWARCAVVKGSSEVAVPTFPWYWNENVRIVSPPGIACFRAGERYTHGGVSPQECVVPDLIVERGVEASFASIQSVQWRGMRCKVRVETNDPGLQIDLRTNWKQAATSIVAAAKPVGSSGEVSLAVVDDKYEGAAASVVVLDAGGKVVVSLTTCVGEKA